MAKNLKKLRKIFLLEDLSFWRKKRKDVLGKVRTLLKTFQKDYEMYKLDHNTLDRLMNNFLSMLSVRPDTIGPSLETYEVEILTSKTHRKDFPNFSTCNDFLDLFFDFKKHWKGLEFISKNDFISFLETVIAKNSSYFKDENNEKIHF